MPNVGRQGMRCPRCDSVVYVSMLETAEYPFRGGDLCGKIDISKTHRQLRKMEVDHFFCSGCEAIWSDKTALYQAVYEAAKERR